VNSSRYSNATSDNSHSILRNKSLLLSFIFSNPFVSESFSFIVVNMSWRVPENVQERFTAFRPVPGPHIGSRKTETPN
jgi:hypothetical protein